MNNIDENINECHMDYYNEYCPFMKKPCKEVDHDVCEALIEAYDQGYENGYG